MQLKTVSQMYYKSGSLAHMYLGLNRFLYGKGPYFFSIPDFAHVTLKIGTVYGGREDFK